MDRKVASFLALAREDLGVAKNLREKFPRQATFHLQQAAEKIIKAVLTKENILAGATHQLGALAARLPSDHPWRADLMALDKHTPAATMYRYPTPGGAMPKTPDAEKIAADIVEVEALLAGIEGWCGQKGQQTQ